MAWVMTTMLLATLVWLVKVELDGSKRQQEFLRRLSPEIETLKSRADMRYAYRSGRISRPQ